KLSSYSICFLFSCSALHRDLHSFPTRRSSDLVLREKVALKSLTISPPESYASYNDVKENYPSDHADDEEAVMLEGEDFSTKNTRSEEHTSELQSRFDLVCRLLLEKKKNIEHRR